MKGKIVPAVHGRSVISRESPATLAFARRLRAELSPADLERLYAAHSFDPSPAGELLRGVVFRALVKKMGHGVRIGVGVTFRHPETFVIGDGVFIGEKATLQGRAGGRFVVGRRAWIGPHSYLDARDLVIGEYVGWGPCARVLGSEHVEEPADRHLIENPLRIEPVRVNAGADIGTGATLLPGVTVGRGAIVGAGAVVTANVASFSVVAGVPARFLRRRAGRGRT